MRGTLTLSTALAAVALAAALHVTPAAAASYDPLVYRAQMALNAKGFDTGAPDGLFGPRTRTALQAWERASGVPAADTVTADVVARLEGSAGASPQPIYNGRGEDRQFPRAPSSELIRQTQHELNRLGYNLTFEGGHLNGETGDAIRNYQARHGLETTGMPSRQLLAQMRRDSERVDPNIVWRTNPVPPSMSSASTSNVGPTSSTSVTTRSSTTTIDNSMTQAELISQTQRELRRHGYSIPSNAGMLDVDTTNAIRAYQSANGMAQTGMPSAQLLATLRADNRMAGQPIPPAQPSYPTSYGSPIPPAQPVQCADFLHQNRPGGSDYNGPPVPGCD
jgi:peptidoglycan hydrolase-like protein with peptidoglycan-binding domain